MTERTRDRERPRELEVKKGTLVTMKGHLCNL